MTHVACIIPQHPDRIPAIRLDLHRESSARMLDWQAAIIAECRRHDTLNPSLVANLKRMKLLDRCTFLASDVAGGPLRFRYIGCPTIHVLGRGWARQNLGKPHMDNPHADFPVNLGVEYAEAIDGRAPVFNRISLCGTSAASAYTHALCGWTAADGRQAVLSAIALL